MSAQRLRQAAQTIRETAEKATPGPWESLDNGDRVIAWGDDDSMTYVVDEPMSNGDNAAHIALWSPPVALAVAAWLDWSATEAEIPDHAPDCDGCAPAHAVADLILGSTP